MRELSGRRAVVAFLLLFLMPGAAFAGEASRHLNLTGHWAGWLALAFFVMAYVLVVLEEFTGLRKSKPVILAAGLIWVIIAAYVQTHATSVAVGDALEATMNEFAQLFLFLLVAMTYVNAMAERNVFEALRSWLSRRQFSFRQLFWITGFLAFFISPVIDNLTTSLVLSAIVLAVAGGDRRFIALACINIVVGANAGGTYSPFGDITTLMVWQTNVVGFLGFFKLFLPAAVNFLVPAAFMHFAVPKGMPGQGVEAVGVKRGGILTIILFALTILTAVSVHNFLDMPPYVGMMLGLAYLQLLMYYLLKTSEHRGRLLGRYHDSGEVPPAHLVEFEKSGESPKHFNIFKHVADSEWDTLLFFYGVILCVGGLGFLGYLSVVAQVMYVHLGATVANTIVGLLSAVVDNIPIMAAVIQMDPAMPASQWLLITLTAGVGGSILSIGSAAGVALMGQARGHYTFFSHLKWAPVILLGYAASIAIHLALGGGYA